nr:hypothetical protein [Bifidobacterium sp. UBA744]
MHSALRADLMKTNPSISVAKSGISPAPSVAVGNDHHVRLDEAGYDHSRYFIEVGNGTGIRGIGLMPGRNASTISREAKRNTWLPSNENESYRPYRPKRLKPGPRTGRHCTAGPAQRKADRRRSTPRKPRRLSRNRLWARVAGWLGRGRSQPLISGRLRMEYPESPCVCSATAHPPKPSPTNC